MGKKQSKKPGAGFAIGMIVGLLFGAVMERVGLGIVVISTAIGSAIFVMRKK